MPSKLVQVTESDYLSGSLIVDRAAGTIDGVKMLGKESKNNHGIRDDDGNLVKKTRYEPEAIRNALNAYEGKKGYADHPPKGAPNAERTTDDPLVVWTNVRERDGELFGKMNLIKSHPVAQRLMDAAENPILHTLFSCSHNAYGRGEVKNGEFVISEIPEHLIRSVDVVADGGSCHSLLEGREFMTMKFKEIVGKFRAPKLAKAIESKKSRIVRGFVRLLEMDEYGGMEMQPPPAAMVAEPEKEPGLDMGDQSEESSIEHHLAMLVKAVLMNADLDNDMKLQKICGVFKQMLTTGEQPAPEEDDEEEEVPEEEEEEAIATPAAEGKELPGAKKTPMKKEEKDMKESLRKATQENKALKLCMEAGISAKPVQIKAIALLESEEEMKALIAEMNVAKFPGGRRPQSTIQRGTRTVPTTESREADLAKLAQNEPGKLASLLRN